MGSEMCIRDRHFPCLGREARCHDAFQKQTGELTGRRGFHHTIDGDDAAEGTHTIGIQGPRQCSRNGSSDRHTAGVGVLDDHGGRLQGRRGTIGSVAELPHRGESRLEIQQVVGAQLLALQLDSTCLLYTSDAADE